MAASSVVAASQLGRGVSRPDSPPSSRGVRTSLGTPPERLCANPRHDPGFVDRCLEDLLRHWGAWRPLGRLYAPECDCGVRCTAVRDAVVCGRRLGMVIEARHGLGYRIVAWRHPMRIYRVKPGRKSKGDG